MMRAPFQHMFFAGDVPDPAVLGPGAAPRHQRRGLGAAAHLLAAGRPKHDAPNIPALRVDPTLAGCDYLRQSQHS